MDILSFHPERHPVVTGDGDRVMPLAIARVRMKPRQRCDIGQPFRPAQNIENQQQSAMQPLVDPPCRAADEQFFKVLVTKRRERHTVSPRR